MRVESGRVGFAVFAVVVGGVLCAEGHCGIRGRTLSRRTQVQRRLPEQPRASRPLPATGTLFFELIFPFDFIESLFCNFFPLSGTCNIFQVLANISGPPPSTEQIARLQKLLTLQAKLVVQLNTLKQQAALSAAASAHAPAVPVTSRPEASGDETDSSMPMLESSVAGAQQSGLSSDCEMPSLPAADVQNSSFASLDSSHDESGYLALLQQPHSPVSDTKVRRTECCHGYITTHKVSVVCSAIS